MNSHIPSIDSMLEDLHRAGWITLDPRLSEASPDADPWSEEDLRSQWFRLQQRNAHTAIVEDPLAAG